MDEPYGGKLLVKGTLYRPSVSKISVSAIHIGIYGHISRKIMISMQNLQIVTFFKIFLGKRSVIQKMQKNIVYCKFMPAEFTQFCFVIVSLFLDVFFCLLLSIFVFLISKKAYLKVNCPIRRVYLFSNGTFSYIPCPRKIQFTNTSVHQPHCVYLKQWIRWSLTKPADCMKA